jgi:hypothetical protein
MERVPEYTDNLHFFRLLFLLCRRNRVSLKVPPTLIKGFGFEKLMFMSATSLGIRFESVASAEEILSRLESMQLYTPEQRIGLPMYLVKTEGEKLVCQSKAEASTHIQTLLAQEGMH